MFRLKTLSFFVGVVATLALSATPASALFSSTQTQGKVTVLASGIFNYAGQGTVTCPPTEIVAQWHIGKTNGIKVQQEQVLEGPNLSIQVKNWGPNCTAEIGKTKVAAGEIEVKACDFLLVQATKGSLSPTGGVAESCLLKIGKGTKPLCEIQVPAGMETSPGSNSGINVGLAKGTIANEGANILGKVNAEEGGTGGLAGKGIFAESVGTNALCTLKKVTEEATLTGLEGKLENIKAV